MKHCFNLFESNLYIFWPHTICACKFRKKMRSKKFQTSKYFMVHKVRSSIITTIIKPPQNSNLMSYCNLSLHFYVFNVIRYYRLAFIARFWYRLHIRMTLVWLLSNCISDWNKTWSTFLNKHKIPALFER